MALQTMTEHRGTGFTLLEVLIAVFVAATALLAVWKLHAQNAELVSDIQFQATAPFLAEQALAEIDALPPERHASGPCRVDDAAASSGTIPLRCEILIEWMDPKPWKSLGASVERIDITVSDASETNRFRLRGYRFYPVSSDSRSGRK
uniref:Prepilin-type N-terminal cleavage/methylation domain-containing protein n=1 Tax=Desulfatirhabdium butyrativorans TaxID=340467 RepID=A0A7C4VQL6_9BACT